MEELLENSRILKQKREKYLEAREVMSKSQVDLLETEILYEADDVFTHEQLMKMGANIKEIYDSTAEESRNKILKDERKGAPWILSGYVDNFGAVYEKKSHDENPYKTNKRGIVFDDDPSVNYQNEYYRCIEEIRKHEFEVLSMKIRPTHYYNRTSSSCFSDYYGFIFECKKNNYTFTVRFNDDCDCLPGILGLSNIVHTPTGNKISGYCDLYCQNTSEGATSSILSLLNFSDIDEYRYKTFNKFNELSRLLPQDNSHKIELIEDKSSVIINDGELNFYIKMSAEDDDNDLLLIPIHEDGEYILYLSTATYTDRWDGEKEVKNMYDFTDHTKNDQFKIKWESGDNHALLDYQSSQAYVDNLHELIDLINYYIDYINGDYGFYDGTQFYNKYNVQNIFPKESKVGFSHCENLSLGKVIDTTILYYKGTDLTPMFSDKIFPEEEEYPRERYIIHITYNKGDTSAFATIEGDYINVSEIAKYYYEKGLDNYNIEIKPVAPEVHLEGSLPDLLKEISKLVD